MYRPVIKARIVEYRWETWDRSSDSPAEYPEGSEPENYILTRPHSPAIAALVGSLWEVIIPESASVDAVRVGRGEYQFRIDPATWNGAPMFRPTGKRHIMVTEGVSRWLQDRVGAWLSFQEAIATC